MADISAKLVQELRQKTGAGMMDCKKALTENSGDLEKAIDWLRKKGIASAGKKASNVAAEGLVDSYIHIGGRIGVLVEVNCQTDFVARGDDFKTLVKNIAMQIAANPNVEYVKVEDIPTEIAEKEKAIEMGKDDLSGKPDNIKEKIVQGRIDKRLKEICLLDQPYIKDQTITISDLVTQHIAKLGENIQVRRFVRFTLGEGIEKKEVDFAAEVAAQVGKAASAKAEPSPAVAPAAETAVAEAAPVMAEMAEAVTVVPVETDAEAVETPEVTDVAPVEPDAEVETSEVTDVAPVEPDAEVETSEVTDVAPVEPDAEVAVTPEVMDATSVETETEVVETSEVMDAAPVEPAVEVIQAPEAVAPAPVELEAEVDETPKAETKAAKKTDKKKKGKK